MKTTDYVLCVYKEKSFSAAAKKLFISQPALSMAIKKLEENIGITIFDRSSSSLTPTAEGRIYIEALEEIKLIENQAMLKLFDMADLRTGHITVSGENFVSSFILPEILMRYANRYPGVDVDIVESNSPDLRRLLIDESIDLLIAHDFDKSLYESIELFEEDVLLAVPKANKINNTLSRFSISSDEITKKKHKTKEPVDLSLFRFEDFLILKPGNDMCRRATALCSEYSFTPKTKIALDQLITAYNLCGFGMGLTFVTDILVDKANVDGCLYYRIKSDYAHRTMSLGYKKNRYISYAAKAFIELAIEVYS